MAKESEHLGGEKHRYFNGINGDMEPSFLPRRKGMHVQRPTDAIGYEDDEGRRFFYDAVPVSLEDARKSFESHRANVPPNPQLQRAIRNWENTAKDKTLPVYDPEVHGPYEKANGPFRPPAHHTPLWAKPFPRDTQSTWEERLAEERREILGFIHMCDPTPETVGDGISRGPIPVRACDFIIQTEISGEPREKYLRAEKFFARDAGNVSVL